MIDMRKINNQIRSKVEPGFRVDTIQVNLDAYTPDIEEEERPKLIDQWQAIARNQYGYTVTVEPINDIEKLTDYRIECSECGEEPLFDEKQEEYYCPACYQRSLFDY